MYDLLPLFRPDWFRRRNSRAYRAWIRTIAVHADSVACISQSVAAQFRAWLFELGFDREASPAVAWFHLGMQPTNGRPVARGVRVERLAERPFVLMVGTIEPRKGYALSLPGLQST